MEYIDNTDRVAAERALAITKHSYSLGIIKTKFDSTTRSSIQLSIIAMSLNRLETVLLCVDFVWVISRLKTRLARSYYCILYVQNGQLLEKAAR